ncbi:hypothetical protein LUZ60_011992 [Juncus effusus]|nr:hypothetical protein LUZ60_011992 [Juncus effusus]
MAETSERRNSNNSQILQELDALTHTMYQAHSARRTASLVLPRSATPTPTASEVAQPNTHPEPVRSESRPRARRLSMSPWRSRPNEDTEDNEIAPSVGRAQLQKQNTMTVEPTSASEKKGIWKWKPLRALSHISMHRSSCLFSVEVVTVQGLPASMNGLRLSVSVRKKETKEGAVQTMPARVLQGSADFEETLFIKCHVYCSGGAGMGKPLKLEEKLFVVSAIAIDAPELDLGKNMVDLSRMVKEAMEKLNSEGARIRQWDTKFKLIGKAKGGELVVKLGFQIMEEGGVGFYNQSESGKSTSSSAYARTQSKSSFSVASPKVSRSEPSFTPTRDLPVEDLKGIDDFTLDGPGHEEPEAKDELDMPDFDIEDKGIEVQEESKDEKEKKEEKEQPTEKEEEIEVVDTVEETSVTKEVVKEVVHDSAHYTRMTELEAIAEQIKALESMMTIEKESEENKLIQEDETVRLDTEEETVRKEFLQMLDLEDELKSGFEFDTPQVRTGKEFSVENENKIYISVLGKGLGPVVQTRDGGYLASMNPFDIEVGKKDTPKLTMQISKPFIISNQKLTNGFEFFQRLAVFGAEELGSKITDLISMDEIMGKTAEQIAFEGMASAIVTGRNKEGASSSAAKSILALKTMSMGMNEGRKQRILTGIWNSKEEPVPLEEILGVSLQKIETMAIDALKIQADVADEQAPFDVSPLGNKSAESNILDSMIPLENCENESDTLIMMVAVQLRDPMRRYEIVGGPSIALIQAVRSEGNGNDNEDKYKVTSLHVGGVKIRSGVKKSIFDGDKQRLTAMQWLVAYGLGKTGKKGGKIVQGKGVDLMFSISSRVMADMWLKPIRNPDVKMTEK